MSSSPYSNAMAYDRRRRSGERLAVPWEPEEQLERGPLSDAEGEKIESEFLQTIWAAC